MLLCAMIFFIRQSIYSEENHASVISSEPQITIYVVSENPKLFQTMKHMWKAQIASAHIEFLSTQKYYQKFPAGIMRNANHFLVAQGYQGEFFFTSDLDSIFDSVKIAHVQRAIREYRLREMDLRQAADTQLEKAIECMRSGDQRRGAAFLKRIRSDELSANLRATYFRMRKL